MKDKSTKYIEACERNVGLHERIQKNNVTSDLKFNKYKGKTLAQARHGLGIKADDEHYDVRINKLIKEV